MKQNTNSKSPKENSIRLLTKLSTFVGVYLKTQMSGQYRSSGNEEVDALHCQELVKLVLNGINFVGATFMTEFMVWIYIGKYDPQRKPDRKLVLPSITSSMPMAMGERIMIDPEINNKWNMMVGQVGTFPYSGERVIPIIVQVKDEAEMKELVDIISLKIGSDQQEESLRSQQDSAETSQIPPVQ